MNLTRIRDRAVLKPNRKELEQKFGINENFQLLLQNHIDDYGN